MVKEFDISERKIILFEAYPDSSPSKRDICPDCIGHAQLNMREVNELSVKYDSELDCKNLFLENGKIVGQCCCYSIVHAIGYQELIEEPMLWICDECSPNDCKIQGRITQNEKPQAHQCPENKNPVWYAKRWIRYNIPDPRYENWIRYFGTEADMILWKQEKKDRGVNI